MKITSLLPYSTMRALLVVILIFEVVIIGLDFNTIASYPFICEINGLITLDNFTLVIASIDTAYAIVILFTLFSSLLNEYEDNQLDCINFHWPLIGAFLKYILFPAFVLGAIVKFFLIIITTLLLVSYSGGCLIANGEIQFLQFVIGIMCLGITNAIIQVVVYYYTIFKKIKIF